MKSTLFLHRSRILLITLFCSYAVGVYSSISESDDEPARPEAHEGELTFSGTVTASTCAVTSVVVDGTATTGTSATIDYGNINIPDTGNSTFGKYIEGTRKDIELKTNCMFQESETISIRLSGETVASMSSYFIEPNSDHGVGVEINLKRGAKLEDGKKQIIYPPRGRDEDSIFLQSQLRIVSLNGLKAGRFHIPVQYTISYK